MTKDFMKLFSIYDNISLVFGSKYARLDSSVGRAED